MEINVILSAIQSAFATSVQQAVAAATAPLVERIAALEKNEEYLTRRITALEGDISHKVQVQQANIVAALADRIAALESGPSAIVEEQRGIDDELVRIKQRVAVLEGSHQMSADAFVTHLDQQEWFWHKIAGFVANNSEITGHDLEVVKDRIAALESETQGENRYLNRDEVNELIAEAIDDHLGTYDHDEYDNHLNDDDKHFDGDIEDAVRDALNGTSVTLSF